jgi:hypothetical protein
MGSKSIVSILGVFMVPTPRTRNVPENFSLVTIVSPMGPPPCGCVLNWKAVRGH